MTQDPTQPQQNMRRQIPQNELDLNMMTTDSVWGKTEVPPELKARLKQLYKVVGVDDETGKLTEEVTQESMWGLLGFYTRDMRLANLSDKVYNNEIIYCQYYLDLAGDFLQANMIKPFLISLQRVATILELSQSKNGFLRRRMNTITQESHYREEEPPKKSLFGVGNKNKGGSY